MSLDYIRQYYKVPANLGQRVRFTGFSGRHPIEGRIVGSDGPYILVRFDGQSTKTLLHPIWEVEYLDGKESNEGKPTLAQRSG